MTITQTIKRTVTPTLQHPTSHAAFHIKIRKKAIAKCFQALISIIFMAVITFFIIDLIRFPECYISTWKYQLKNDIAVGVPEAMQYYQMNYINKGRPLYGERFAEGQKQTPPD